MTTDTMTYDAVSEYYRHAIAGHVYIADTIDALFATVRQRIERLGHPPRILELGSHAGIITEMLLQHWPQARIVVHDENAELVAMARRRLTGRDVRFETGPLEALTTRADLVLSVARHHHLPHGYLTAVRQKLGPEGVYVVADELCPEYCEQEHAARIEQAEVLHIVGGYVLTSRESWRPTRRMASFRNPRSSSSAGGSAHCGAGIVS